MKQYLLSFFLLLSVAANAQWRLNEIQGSGKSERQTRAVGSFTSVSNTGSWDIMISEGNSESIEIEGDDNLLPYIETKVEGGTLIVRTSKGVSIKTRKRITIYVTMTSIRELTLSGSGDIMGKGAFTSDRTVLVKVSGSGSIKLDFKRFPGLETSISGSGSIAMTGTTEKLSAVVSGSGSINCYDVISDHVAGKVRGSGSIRVHANLSIDGSISGSGNIYYRGAATNVQTHRSGSGKVVRS